MRIEVLFGCPRNTFDSQQSIRKDSFFRTAKTLSNGGNKLTKNGLHFDSYVFLSTDRFDRFFTNKVIRIHILFKTFKKQRQIEINIDLLRFIPISPNQLIFDRTMIDLTRKFILKVKLFKFGALFSLFKNRGFLLRIYFLTGQIVIRNLILILYCFFHYKFLFYFLIINFL